MKKRLLLILLSLALCVAGAAFAFGCTQEPPAREPIKYTVTFTDGDEIINTYSVEEGKTLPEFPALPSKDGYTVKWVDANGEELDITKVITGNIGYVSQYVACEDTAYKVEYYVEKLIRGYSLDSSETLYGTTDSTVSATPKTIDGFTYDDTQTSNVISGTVVGDGSLVLKLYYKRNTYDVKFMAYGAQIATETVKYGATVAEVTENIPANKDAIKEDVFKHWSLNENGEAYDFDTEVKGEVVLYAVYDSKSIKYAVDVEVENDFYTITKKDGSAWTNEELTSFVYDSTFDFRVVLGEEATGNIVVKAGDTVVNPVEGVYSVTVQGDVTITVDGYELREYALTGHVVVDARQSEIDWAKTVTSPEQVVVVVDGETYVENAVDENGKYTVGGLVKGEYTLTFAYKSGDEYKIICNDSVTASVGADYADENGEVAVDQTVAVGTISYTIRAGNDTYGLHNGMINATTLVGTGAGDNVYVTMKDFVPGENDFIVTTSYEQTIDLEHMSDEGAPTIGLRFHNGDKFVTLGVFGEGNVRFVINNKNNDQGKVLSQVGGIMGNSSWGDTYRSAQLTYVRRGNIVALYATLKNGPYVSGTTIKTTSAKSVENMLMFYIDLDTNTAYMSDIKHGTSAYGTETWYHKTFVSEEFANVFANVTQVTAQSMTSKFFYVNFYGMNYSTDEEVVNNGFHTVSGKITNEKQKVNKDAYLHFISENGTEYFAPVNDDNSFTAFLPKGTYTVIGKSGYASTTKLIVTADTESAGTFALSKLTYTNKLQNDYGNLSHVVNEDGSLTGVAGNPIETAVNTSFIPAQQVLTFGYTLKGNLSDTNYPYYGMFIMNPTVRYGQYTVESTTYKTKYKMARVTYTNGAGGIMCTLNEANGASGKVGGSRFNLLADTVANRLFKAGWVTGEKDLAFDKFTSRGTYSADMYANLDIKFVVDGYKYSLYVKGSNTYWGDNEDADTIMNNLITWQSDEWVECFANVDIRERANTVMPQHISQIYDAEQPCFFGVSSREDKETNAEGNPVNLSQFTDVWYEIANR